MGELEHLVQARRRVPTEDPHEDEQEAHRLRSAYRNAMQRNAIRRRCDSRNGCTLERAPIRL